jgi:hypothetical protein
MYKENKMDELFEAYLAVYEANRYEKHLGLTGQKGLDRAKKMVLRARRGFHRAGIGSSPDKGMEGRQSKETPYAIENKPSTLSFNARMRRNLHKKRRGENYKYKTDSTVSRERNPITPPKIKISMSSLGPMDNTLPKKLEKLAKNNQPPSNNIRRLVREELEYIVDILVSEGYVNDYDSAACILEAMSDEWLVGILSEAPYQIYGPDPHGSSDSESRPIGNPYKNKKRAKNRADRMDQEIGGYRHSVRYVEDDK